MKIVKNPNLNLPHGNTIIWRYFGLDKFLDLILSQELFFCNAAKMTDRFEGIVPKKNKKRIIENIRKEGYSYVDAKTEAEIQTIQINNLRELTTLNCWTMSPHESYALWKIYLKGSNSGVALKSTVSRLLNSIHLEKRDLNIHYAPVNYSDEIDDPNNRYQVITTKNKFYDFEKELRLFIFDYSPAEGGSSTSFPPGSSKRVKIKIETLIDEIYFSPFTARWFDISLSKTIKKLAPTLVDRIRNSEIQDE